MPTSVALRGNNKGIQGNTEVFRRWNSRSTDHLSYQMFLKYKKTLVGEITLPDAKDLVRKGEARIVNATVYLKKSPRKKTAKQS